VALSQTSSLGVGSIPAEITNLTGGEAVPPASGEWLQKLRPKDGSPLCLVARSGAEDVDAAVAAARRAQPGWAERTPVERGDLVREIALGLRERRQELSETVAAETGKPIALALGETDAAIEMGLFIAGEGRRSYGRTTTATMAHRTVLTVRQPVGVAGLVISFNTPLPNVAWKVFPAVFCGNAAVLKPSEETPASAHLFATVCCEVGLPAGVLNVVHGLGPEAGAALVGHSGVDLVSFTGSAETGRAVNEAAASRLAKVCLELGGKNALVVCDDAELGNAVRWSLASAFSNAGQRCASASRIVVFEAVYDEFRVRLVEGATRLDDVGPVISEGSLERILGAVTRAREQGATVLCGGERLPGPGWHVAATALEGVATNAEISCTELFGPVTILYRARDLDDALAIVNESPYGLTSAIHTASLHRAMRFAEQAQAGVVVVNGGTHGSEPHMGFGGVKQSGTGWRESGLEALDVYSEWKYVNLIADPTKA
jgi:alpha-ketoglutaric semialdehyde dehydrogenase